MHQCQCRRSDDVVGDDVASMIVRCLVSAMVRTLQQGMTPTRHNTRLFIINTEWMIIIEVHLDEQDYHVLILITSKGINASGQNKPFFVHIDGSLTIVSSKR